MSIAQWSTTPGSNANAADNINWAEGQAPSSVNNSSRQEMTDVADWYRNDAEWIDRNDTVAFSSGTILSFTSANLTGIYSVGRRIRTVSSTPGTLHGRITASSTSGSNTLVTVTFDSTAVLANEAITDVSVGIIKNSTASSSLDAQNISRIEQFGIPTGALIPFGSTASEPTGFAFCNGQALSRATEALLFAVIGTSYGSSSTGTFAVPDLRGRIPVALDNLGGTSANRITSTAADTLGGATGVESTSQAVTLTGGVTSTALTEANLPTSVSATFSFGNVNNAGTVFARGDTTDNPNTISETMTSFGSGTAHAHANNFAVSSTDTITVIQPSMFMPWIIKK